MGILMGRAFREGVSQNRKVTMRAKTRSWKPLADLQGLSGRTKTIGNDMGPLVEVPAMVRIENEKWIKESNLDLNDLSIDPSYFEFNLTYPKPYSLISDLDKLKITENLDSKEFVSRPEIRKNSNIILTKNNNFKKYKFNKINLYTDFEVFQEKQDSIINQTLSYIDNKIGNMKPGIYAIQNACKSLVYPIYIS